MKLAPMESAVKEGVNSISVVPEGAVSELQADSSKGALVSGTLGDVGLPELVPRSAGSFGAFFSGRSLGVRIGASTDGVRYSLPVTVTDSAGGRTLNTVIELPLEVHGSPETAGVKEGRRRIADLYGLGGGDLVVPWRFEQLDSRFRMEPVSIEGSADVPLIAGDSTGTTGIRLYAPETSGEREVVVEFLPGGLDTVSVLFGRIFPYLNLRVRDAATSAGLLHGRDYTWTGSGIRQGTQLTTRPNRNTT